MIRTFVQAVLLLTFPFLVGCAEWYHPALSQIRTDLPVGTPLRTVDTYLDQHEIDHVYYGKSNQVTATIHNIQRDALVREDLYLVFSFDEYKSLRDILAKPAFTQP